MSERKRLGPAAALVLLALAGCAAPTTSEGPPAPPPAVQPPQPIVGGAAMDPARTILENLEKSADHRILVRAIRAAGLEAWLAGPLTLFAPTDAAFARLPAGTLDALMEPQNRRLLAQLVSYHVLPGARKMSAIAADASASGGTAAYRTMEGGSIRIAAAGEIPAVSDVHGNRSAIAVADVVNSNGIVHVVDAVLLPAT